MQVPSQGRVRDRITFKIAYPPARLLEAIRVPGFDPVIASLRRGLDPVIPSAG